MSYLVIEELQSQNNTNYSNNYVKTSTEHFRKQKKKVKGEHVQILTEGFMHELKTLKKGRKKKRRIKEGTSKQKIINNKIISNMKI